MRLSLVSFLLLAACAPPPWQAPTASAALICDAAQTRADIGRTTDADRRPRPECRPAPAAPTR